MWSATRECGKCDGRGFRQLLGPFHVECRRCHGSGHVFRPAARIWAAIRGRSGGED